MKAYNKREYYKPFDFPWAIDACKQQHSMHWLPEEVPMKDDISDWKNKLSDAEKNLLTQIFRFFTQGDIDVANGYVDRYLKVFKNPDLRMMMLSFASMETIHILAYAHLLDTVGMPDVEYKAFMDYQEMVEKHEYVNSIELHPRMDDTYDTEDVLKSIAIYSAFTEGMQLFSSFAILLNFTRFGKMNGMGQIVTWSIRDETLHVNSMIGVFRTIVENNKELWESNRGDEIRGEIYKACRQMVELEDNFIDLAFEQGGIEGLTKEEVKEYIRYIADRRLLQLGLKPNYKVKINPLPWLADMLNSIEHGNFFETRVTEYNKGKLTGSWDNVWAKIDKGVGE